MLCNTFEIIYKNSEKKYRPLRDGLKGGVHARLFEEQFSLALEAEAHHDIVDLFAHGTAVGIAILAVLGAQLGVIFFIDAAAADIVAIVIDYPLDADHNYDLLARWFHFCGHILSQQCGKTNAGG